VPTTKVAGCCSRLRRNVDKIETEAAAAADAAPPASKKEEEHFVHVYRNSRFHRSRGITPGVDHRGGGPDMHEMGVGMHGDDYQETLKDPLLRDYMSEYSFRYKKRHFPEILMPLVPLAAHAVVKEARASAMYLRSSAVFFDARTSTRNDIDNILLEKENEEIKHQLRLAAKEAAEQRAARDAELHAALDDRKKGGCKRRVCNFRFPIWFNHVLVVTCLLCVAALLFFTSTYVVKFALEGEEVKRTPLSLSLSLSLSLFLSFSISQTFTEVVCYCDIVIRLRSRRRHWPLATAPSSTTKPMSL
jgi:hypothetical protein